jgi:hypothetical protein
MKFCDESLIYASLHELARVVHAAAQCQDDIVKQFERIFEYGKSMSVAQKAALTLAGGELRQCLDEKHFKTLTQLIDRLPNRDAKKSTQGINGHADQE